MTCSEYCKAEAGVTLAKVQEISGRHRVTLDRWFRNDRQLFDLLLDGVKHRLHNADQKDDKKRGR
ncbi:MAG: hypothetical protein CMI01_00300 [Oceanospirillaceae bacterium]|nr:hypothetical protein [Oceanospirillaceae bacterium]MBS97107.1 hypothetical protein [Oceanospirillaceae bacterium]|tara:strand:- start:482 stop:676 length:195 start_codon:yes stop_codon:yes gene_type:complete